MAGSTWTPRLHNFSQAGGGRFLFQHDNARQVHKEMFFSLEWKNLTGLRRALSPMQHFLDEFNEHQLRARPYRPASVLNF